MQTDKLVVWVIGGGLFLGFLGLVGIWYLAVFAVALGITLVILVAANRQRKSPLLQFDFDPHEPLPLELWGKLRDAPVPSGGSVATFRVVDTDLFPQSVAVVKKDAQVDRAGSVTLEARMIVMRGKEHGDAKLAILFERRVVGFIPDLDARRILESISRAGGMLVVVLKLKFDSGLTISSSHVEFRTDFHSEGETPHSLSAFAVFQVVWAALRGKKV